MGAYYRYYRNPACNCVRCRIRCATGPAMMITVGVLFLLQTLNVVRFHYTWPVLLIVIGVIQVLGHSAPAEGHLQPGWWQNSVGTAPPAPGAPTSSSGNPPQNVSGGPNV